METVLVAIFHGNTINKNRSTCDPVKQYEEWMEELKLKLQKRHKRTINYHKSGPY